LTSPPYLILKDYGVAIGNSVHSEILVWSWCWRYMRKCLHVFV